MRSSLFCFSFVFLLFESSLADDRGRVRGQVTADAGPIGGVSVAVVELSLATLTDARGAYSFDSVPPGHYTLTFTLGTNTATEKIAVTRDETTQRDLHVEWETTYAETVTVYASSRRIERVADAPAAVTVIDEAQIEREAAHAQLPKLLETTAGVDSTQSGLYDFNFNARGFNSSINRRVLTLVDGRDMSDDQLYTPSWVFVAASGLDDLASVEFVRGPGSALYGANAYNGVLSISSKSPRESQGGIVRLSGGGPSSGRVDVRYAGALGDEWYYRVLGSYMDSDDFAVSRNESVEYEGLPEEAIPLPLDTIELMSGMVRFDKHLDAGSVLTVEGSLGGSDGRTWVTGIGRLQDTHSLSGWVRANYSSTHWNLLFHHRRTDWEGTALGSGGELFNDLSTLDAEIQGFADFAQGKGRFIGGFSFRRRSTDTANDEGAQTSLLEPRVDYMEGLFGQLDYDLTDRLKMVLAGRLDFSTLHEARLSPKASLVYSFSPAHSMRVSYNEGFQSPNLSEFYLGVWAAAPVSLSAIEDSLSEALGTDLGLGFESVPILALGNRNLDVETIRSFEVGYSNLFHRKLLLNLTYYYSRLDDFVTELLPGVNPDYGPYQPPSDLSPEVQALVLGTLDALLPEQLMAIMSNSLYDGSPIFAAGSYTNAGTVNSQGIELALEYFLNPNWKLDSNYTWLDYEVEDTLLGDEILANAPRHRVNAGVAWVSDRFDASARYRWVDAFPWAAGINAGPVHAYTVVDLTANTYFTNGLALGLNVSNLFDQEHYQSFGGDLLGRRMLLTATYRW